MMLGLGDNQTPANPIQNAPAPLSGNLGIFDALFAPVTAIQGALGMQQDLLSNSAIAIAVVLYGGGLWLLLKK